MVACATTALAKHAYAVGFINHHTGIILLGKTNNFGQISHVAFHREHAVGDDELHLIFVALLQLLLKRSHVVVLIFQRIGERQTASFNNRSMVLFVPNDVVVASSE